MTNSISFAFKIDNDVQFAQICGVINTFTIRKPIKIASKFVENENEFTESCTINKQTYTEETCISITEFNKFLLPKLNDYVIKKKQELLEKELLFKEVLRIFLRKGKNKLLLKDLIKLIED